MSQPSAMVRKIIELLQAHPNGLTSGEIRAKLGIDAEEQAQLDRRRREIRQWYHLEVEQVGNRAVYKLGERKAVVGSSAINLRVRAQVLNAARGRCQMCGRTVEHDHVKLAVDHKIPRDWGGSDELDNLWALCEDCNSGKKNLFATEDQNLMRQVMCHRSVHMRIGELLRINLGKPVPAKLLEFVANQDDWKKRTRELRYLGWEILVSKTKSPSGRVNSQYTAVRTVEWPEDPTAWIREYERNREAANTQSRKSKLGLDDQM